nr:MAG TPA: hypothetical protein [Caudoviricetes sp.]
MSKDSGNQLYSVWTYKPVRFVLQWDNYGNIDITNDADGVVSKVTIANLLEPSQIERKGFLTDHVIGKKIELAHPSYTIDPGEFASAIALFVFGIFPMQLSAFEITLDGEPFNWRQESDKYLYG